MPQPINPANGVSKTQPVNHRQTQKTQTSTPESKTNPTKNTRKNPPSGIGKKINILA